VLVIIRKSKEEGIPSYEVAGVDIKAGGSLEKGRFAQRSQCEMPGANDEGKKAILQVDQ